MRYVGLAVLLFCWHLAACERHHAGELDLPGQAPTVTPTATGSPNHSQRNEQKKDSENGRLGDAEKVVKILAILAAGVAGYYKFLRGRVFQPRLEIKMSSQLIAVSGRYFFKVMADLTNTGASRIPFDLETSGLRIFSIGAPPTSGSEIALWEHVVTLDMTDRHNWIEGGELVTLNWLVELPASTQVVALRAELRVTGKKTSWYADTIVENDPVILSEKPKQEETEKHGPDEGRLQKDAEAQGPRGGREDQAGEEEAAGAE